MFSSSARKLAWRVVDFRRSRLVLRLIRKGGFHSAVPMRESESLSAEHMRRTEGPARLHSPGITPLLEQTIGQLLGEAAERWPNRECLVSVSQNVRLTFSEMLRRADRLAAGLKKLGMERGDRLGIWGPNDVEWIISSLAAARAGFIAVTINPAFQPNEVIYSIQKVGIKAVVAADAFKTQNYPRMLFEIKEVCPTLKHIVIYSTDHVTGTHRFADVESLPSRSEVERIASEQSEISPYDGCNIQFTSGTTGKPKATLLSHRSVVNNAKQGAQRSELSTERRVCLNVPFFHAFALIMGKLSMLHAGNVIVLEGRSFDPVKSLEAMAREKCDVTYGTPTMWINLLAASQRVNVPTPRLFSGTTGGSPAPPELFKRIKECFRFDNIKTIYGLTEVSGISFQSLPGEDPELTETTVGYLSDHLEAMVVDDKGSIVPFGTPGELWTRGYSSMLRYWADEESTKKTVTSDGWVKTGDRFILRADGYGHIIGRSKDMVIRGGENIFPKEIEDFLMTHPSVLEAQVIGAYDAVYGEQICACIRLREGMRISKEEVKRYCQGKIAHFKIPHYIEFVDEYPKTASGKIQKFRLKKDMEDAGVIPTPPN